MERKAPKITPARNKKAPKASESGTLRGGNQLVRVRSPVQIWVAAPLKPVVPQGIAGFCYALAQEWYIIKPIQKPIPISGESRRELLFASLFQCVPENLAGALHTFLVSVGIHPKGDGFIAVPQLFGYAGNVGPVGNGNTGNSVAQLVGVEARHTAPFGKFLHIPGW